MPPKKIALISDAWDPQVNGVVTTFKNIIPLLNKKGFDVEVLHPEMFSNFEFAVSDRARRENADVVVCGHIHRPEIKELNGVLYCNDGDWIESCTALVEDETGDLSILNWAEERERLKLISFEDKKKMKENAA